MLISAVYIDGHLIEEFCVSRKIFSIKVMWGGELWKIIFEEYAPFFPRALYLSLNKTGFSLIFENTCKVDIIYIFISFFPPEPQFLHLLKTRIMIPMYRIIGGKKESWRHRASYSVPEIY